MRIVSIGHAIFAVVLVAFGVMGLINGDFTPLWDTVPKGLPLRQGLVYLCAVVCVTGGLGLLWRRTAAVAARVLLVYLLLWLLCLRLRDVFPAPAAVGSWYRVTETAVFVAAAWVLYAWFATDWDRRHVGFATGERGLRIARVLYGLTLIFFGVGHFAYLKNTASLVPVWLPWHLAWAYFTGGTFIAAGGAVIIGVLPRLAAALSTLQIGLFALLVYVPIVAAGKADAFTWSETILSSAIAAAAWVLTDSYRGLPWLAVRSGKLPHQASALHAETP